MRSFRSLRGLLACAVALVLVGCGNKSPVAPIVNPPLSAVVVSPDTVRLLVGEDAQLVATAYDTLGVPLATGVTFAWSSTNTAVFTVSSSGHVVARGDGIALAIAAASGQSDTAVVIVDFMAGWYAQSSGTTNNLNGVFMLGDGRTGWAVGDAGTIVHTTNAGVDWDAQASSTSFNLNGVWFTSATTGYAVGHNGTVMKTTNAGTKWTRLTTVGASENLMDVCFADATHGWAVGSAGAIVHTRDGGATWTKRVPTAFQLESVSFSDTANGWAVGAGGVIVGTHDGGASWYIVQPAITSTPLKAVSRRSVTDAWAMGSLGVYAFTTADPDSFSWNLSTVGAANQVEGLQMVTATTGYAVGQNGPGLVLKSVNGGTTWTPQVANSAQGLLDVYFVDDQRGWAVGGGGRIVHTTRGGE